ncbi:DNA repair protein RecO [Desulfofarcimen acetoxidans DSM 771]|uniref:DNA repair protein RecO n=1 Tax=Desulfofarcimen acetoxidans (strain ATCC 49208 / DSM 771 / KCTC 5769 / VKM B-1644 / 5575) TaxID=485916 RepID=C8W3M8_DESAS|nr:DNA repair protein RecO [Desulfofarcimen acetoxidans]ACV63814.1 DNA repair protein RecO [Desulfofarcimen acetoxidans DSM 771]
MKLYKAEAVVLRTRELREADKLLVLYSRQHGKITVAAHGVSKPSSRKRGSVQPFCHTNFLLHKGRQLDSVSQCDGVEIFAHLRSNFELLSCASYLVELVEAFSVEGDPNEYVFLLLVSIFHLLNPLDAELLTRAFEIKLLTVFGFRPHWESCVHCREPLSSGEIRFSPAMGGVLCQSCLEQDARALCLNRGTLETMKKLLAWEPSQLVRLKADQGVRRQLKKILRSYVDYHLEYRVKSARFLDM